eukprot:3941817-Rhodomonas_salina.2
MPGTDLVYGATRSPVLSSGMVLRRASRGSGRRGVETLRVRTRCAYPMPYPSTAHPVAAYASPVSAHSVPILYPIPYCTRTPYYLSSALVVCLADTLAQYRTSRSTRVAAVLRVHYHELGKRAPVPGIVAAHPMSVP